MSNVYKMDIATTILKSNLPSTHYMDDMGGLIFGCKLSGEGKVLRLVSLIKRSY